MIVDEAHSSQTGEAAKELRRMLGTADVDADDDATDAETLLAEAVAARGRQPNLSFFAFTATPKGRTLELFGVKGPDGKHQPSHLYPMRQAIEEGFIEDVLANYLTYDRYFHLEKALLEDPKYDTAKARSALARFVTLHPENLAQKAEIVIEHFRDKIAHRMKGKAKAMVVCSSRPHAVRMWETLRKQVNNNGHDLGVLVAFSGEVEDLTESKANGFPESETATRFNTDELQIMVVAEKFQTGFDQPKLVAMYVDKTLTGLNAVQTLSRLNRTHPDKDGTFVLDFVNDSDDIQEAFAVYHGKTVAPPTDPNLLFDTRDELNDFQILDPGEMQQAAALLLRKGNTHAQIYAAMQPAVERFKNLDEEDQAVFRDALTRFVRVYGFLAQIVKFTNVDLERDYIYCRALVTLIPGQRPGTIDIGSEVELTHLRHEKVFEGSISLTDDEGEVKTIYSGAGPMTDPDEELLSEIIARINERFGTNWTEEDRLVFEAAAQDLVKDDEIQNQAVNNDEATFRDQIFAEQLPEGTARTPRPQLRCRLRVPRQQGHASRRSSRLRSEGPETGHRRPQANLPHRRPSRPRSRVPLPRVQVHPPLGHQATPEVQAHRECHHQDHRRLRQLPLRRHPPHRRIRRRLHPRPRKRLRNLLQTRPTRRPRPLGPTPPEPHPHPPRRLRPLPSHLAIPQNQRPRPRSHQHRPLHPPHPRPQRQARDLLAPHPRQHPLHHRPQTKSPHHRHPLGRNQLISSPRYREVCPGSARRL